ncbi:MAG: cobalamin-dependent protein, partial [Alphaproteobacteria bacterium]
ADPDDVARAAKEGGADFIALSTYNGIALTYLKALRSEMAAIDLQVPLFVGGRLNQVPEQSNTAMPVDVSDRLRALGARVCREVGDMLEELAAGRDRPA